MKLLHPPLHSPLADPQTNLNRESSTTLKFYICSCFSYQVWLFYLLQCFSTETGGVNFQCLKLLHPLLYFPLAEPQTDLYKESSAMLKFKVYSCFFKLTSCAIGQEWSSVTSKKIRHKKLAAFGCYCKT